MKLLLSSLMPNDLTPFLRLFGKNASPHIALVPTASNTTPNEAFITERTARLHDAGFVVTVVNLEDYSHGNLTELDGCWVLGGNTFYLNYWLAQSGADKELTKLLKHDFVYGGESAGAVVAGKTLHGIELLDDPSEAPSVIWEGLAWVNYGILPHWDNATYAERIGQAYEEMRLFGPVKTLADNDNIIMR